MDKEFLTILDELHEKQAELLSILDKDRNFRSYHDITFSFYDRDNKGRFQIQKTLTKAKLLLNDNKQKVYLADEDIIETILEMPVSDRRWFVEQFLSLYNNEGVKFEFSIDSHTFAFLGIPQYPKAKEVMLPSDTLVDINEFITIINFIFAKDTSWERIPINDKSAKKGYKKKNFSKTTLCKFIALIDLYGLHNARSLLYLLRINYPLSLSYSGRTNGEKKQFSKVELFDISNYL